LTAVSRFAKPCSRANLVAQKKVAVCIVEAKNELVTCGVEARALIPNTMPAKDKHHIKELAASYASGSISGAVLASTVKAVVKRAGGVIAVAAATYTFGDCMNWW